MGKTRATVAGAPLQLKVQGLSEPVEVRRHPAARRMTLRVSRTHRAVIVTLPMQCNLKQAGDFLRTHLDWVRERLTSMPDAQPFAHGGMVALRGIPHRIIFIGSKRHTAPVQIVTNEKAPDELHVAGEEEFAPRRLRTWLIQQARIDLADRVRVHARRLGLKTGKLTVRDQTSRWGSCSSNGNLSFSWRLVMAPPQILDYVAAHEVAHLAEMNHGPRFWALVKQTCPQTEEAKAWLRAYGLDLHRYGAPA
ncbi:MAG: M48 family metallopeptidase [Hyphomicrobiaceae bacterium]